MVKGAASYYIIQNVGSILENEDQRGLAHFLEHMAFNGTEHFPGKDINAYTDFDETVYNLDNIPTKDGLSGLRKIQFQKKIHYKLFCSA